jgi:hypothetical protein
MPNDQFQIKQQQQQQQAEEAAAAELTQMLRAVTLQSTTEL